MVSLPGMMIIINHYFHYCTNLGNQGLAIGYFITYLCNNILYYYFFKKEETAFWNYEILDMSHHLSENDKIYSDNEIFRLLS